MKTIENKTKKELMPLDMVRALMIEKGAKTLEDWKKYSDEYNETSIRYYIPAQSTSVIRKYNKTISKILNGKRKNTKPILELRKALDYMKSEKVTNQGQWDRKAKEYNDNDSNMFRIPGSSQVHKYYGKTIMELLTGKNASCICSNKEIISLTDLHNIVDSSWTYKNWAQKTSEFNLKSDKYYIPITSKFFKKTFNITINEFLTGKSNNLQKQPLSLDKTIEYMLDKGCDSFKSWNIIAKGYKDKNFYIPAANSIKRVYNVVGGITGLLNLLGSKEYLELNILKQLLISNKIDSVDKYYKFSKEYNNDKNNKYRIPEGAGGIRNHYNCTIIELCTGTRGLFNIYDLLSAISIHLDDLVLLDKTQLLQIAFLKKFPKDVYEEILECPKGEERRQLLENLPTRIEDIKEDEDLRTFEDSLDEAIEVTKKVQDEEEKEFKEDLKTGVGERKYRKVFLPLIFEVIINIILT